MKKILWRASLAGAAALAAQGTALAQVAGSTTTVAVAVNESTQLAMGWSVKKTLMGKTIYNETGVAVGKIEDLIIAPGKFVSYVIVGAGGFVGIGRHDVAVPVSQIENRSGKLVMPGATKDNVKAMPEFAYADDSARRKQFIAAADADLAKARTQVDAMQKKASLAAADTKTKIDTQVAAVQVDLKAADDKLGEMKSAAANRWKEFEADVTAAMARVRKSLDMTGA